MQAARAARRPIRVFATMVVFLTFALTGPGLGGLELAAHLTGLVDLAHASQAHYEAAGHTAHADECDLGAAAADRRIPASRVEGPLLRTEPCDPVRQVHRAPSSRRLLLPGFPRAPPA